MVSRPRSCCPLRPQFVALLKAGAKLALEAEFDADEALADRLVETAVNALLRVPRRTPKRTFATDPRRR